MRVLVVDDDPVFRDELSELLQEDGNAVSSAPSVQKALEQLEREEVDVVLTDLKMPRQGGLELLKEVRARWPRTMVIVVTGYASVETALGAMKMGAFDYIRKPFRIEQVREALKLAAQEHRFGPSGDSYRDAVREARELAAGGLHEVLLFAEDGPTPSAHLHVEPLDASDPAKLAAIAGAFAAEHANAAVVVSGVERLLERHRLEDIVAILERLRNELAGRGPLRVAFNPRRVSTTVATAIGSAVAADETHATLEALANPIRRRILQRLADGSASFSEAMKAAGLDDSPKLAFHLRKLTETGLVVHENETYKLTGRGAASVRLLVEATFLPTGGREGNLAFPGPPARPASSRAKSRAPAKRKR